MDLMDLGAKWKAFGWEVIESNGNDMSQIIEAMQKAKSLAKKGKPVMNLMRTEMGNGVDFMMGTHKWHGSAPNNEQLAQALAQLEETLGDY